jgi:hypothetical protein
MVLGGPSGAAGQWRTDDTDHIGMRCADAIDPLQIRKAHREMA